MYLQTVRLRTNMLYNHFGQHYISATIRTLQHWINVRIYFEVTWYNYRHIKSFQSFCFETSVDRWHMMRCNVWGGTFIIIFRSANNCGQLLMRVLWTEGNLMQGTIFNLTQACSCNVDIRFLYEWTPAEYEVNHLDQCFAINISNLNLFPKQWF